MKIDNPQVTLADDARTTAGNSGSFAENGFILRTGASGNGFLDWLHQFSLTGEDGKLYSVGGAILSMEREGLDVVTLTVAEGKGRAEQLPGSIYKVGRYPGMLYEGMWRFPSGTLDIRKESEKVTVSCGKQYKVECMADRSWHFILDSLDGRYSADLWHRPSGCPLWYGRETPSYLTQHSITYGYNWAGAVEGSIVLDGRRIKVAGLGIRERYVAVDSCAAEIGGWEDWGWVSFNEIHFSMYDMRLGMKDFALYDLSTGKYYPEGKLSVTHEDWAFLRELDGFIPTVYRIRAEVADGIYEAVAKVCNATTWGATGKVPDNPVATLTYSDVEGTFTGSDGSVRHLTGGRGTMSIREWHAYPNILPRELYMDAAETSECSSKFETL